MTTRKLFPEQGSKTTSAGESKSTSTSFITDVDDEFTMVSYGKKKRGERAVRASSTPTHSTGTGGPSKTQRTMTNSPVLSRAPRSSTSRSPVTTRAKATTASTETALVTLSTFAAFHQLVFPIIDRIAQGGKYQHYDFVKRWKGATAQKTNQVTSTAYFRVISKAFGLQSNDLQGYKKFLQTCPDLDQFLHIFPSPSGSSTGFCYKIIAQNTKPVVDITEEKTTIMEENGKEKHDVIELGISLNEANEESLTPDDEAEVQTIDDTTLATEKEAENETKTITTEPNNRPFLTCYNNDTDFQTMLQAFWPSIQQYIEENPMHHHAQQWVTWLAQGLDLNSDLASVKRFFGCDSFDQLFLFFRDSPAINNCFELQWDHKINYRPHSENKAFMVTPVRTNQEHGIFHSPTSFHNIVLHDPEDINFRILHSKVFDIINHWIRTTTSTNSEPHVIWHKWIWKGLKPSNAFKDLKKIMGIDNLDDYLQSMESFPFLYERFKFYWNEDHTKLHYSIDLTPTATAPEHGANIITQFKKECQRFSQLYDAKLNAIKRGIYELDEKIISCEQAVNKHFDNYERTLHRITKNILNEATAQLTGTVRESVKSLKIQINDEIKVKHLNFEEEMNITIDTLLQDVYKAGNEGHTAMMESHAQLIKDIQHSAASALEIKDSISQFLPLMPTIQQIITQVNQMDTQQSSTNAPQPPANTSSTTPKVAARWGNVKINHDFKPSPNPYVTQIPDPNPVTDQSQQHSGGTIPNMQPPQNVNSIQGTVTGNTTNLSHPHFKPIDGHNVNHPAINADMPPASFQQHQPHNNIKGHSGTSCPVPQTVHVPSPAPPQPTYRDTNYTMGAPGLPPLNHDAAIKRVKIQYTGIGDMFVFYTQLLNALEQFGVFLLPLYKVKYNTSICPTTYQDQPISAQRYDSMSKTLYQKLQNPDVIPMEHTSIRNIINRFAEVNDGYQVLYAMLELVHPVLHEDAVLLPPKSSDCHDDIHLYAQKFDSWLRYETYANRLYSTREQVNCFIRELSPTFAPAVSRIRRLLDTWQPYDTNTPNALQLKQLPNTIERYMVEETGGNIWIRRIGDRSRDTPRDGRDRHNRSKTKEKEKEESPKDTRPLQDVYCSLCGGHGHPDTQCDFSAKLLKTQESLKTIDQKRKAQLQQNFRQEQQKRRARRLKKKLSTIRQMIYGGAEAKEVETLLDSLPELMEQQGEDESTSEQSSASSDNEDDE